MLLWSVLVFAALFRSSGGNCAFTFRAQINPWSVARFSFSHSLFKLSFPSCIDKPSSSLNCAARLHFSLYFYFHFYCSFHFHFIFASLQSIKGLQIIAFLTGQFNFYSLELVFMHIEAVNLVVRKFKWQLTKGL